MSSATNARDRFRCCRFTLGATLTKQRAQFRSEDPLQVLRTDGFSRLVQGAVRKLLPLPICIRGIRSRWIGSIERAAAKISRVAELEHGVREATRCLGTRVRNLFAAIAFHRHGVLPALVSGGIIAFLKLLFGQRVCFASHGHRSVSAHRDPKNDRERRKAWRKETAPEWVW